MIIAAVLPALLMVGYLVRRDLYPEPTPILLCTFLLGALVVVPAATATAWLRPILAHLDAAPLAMLIYAFLIIAPVEELGKLAVLVGFAGRRTQFNEPMDGMVYGGVAGLGFAAMENVFYVAAGGLELAALRAVTALPMHAAVGAIMGFFYGLSRFVPTRRTAFLGYAVLAPIGLHGAYNYPLLLNETFEALGGGTAWLNVLAFAVLAFQIGLALALLRRLRLSQREGHHEGAPDADFAAAGAPFQRFSIARHLKGPAAVTIGGLLTWVTGTSLLTLAAGLFGAWMHAPPDAPLGRARTSAGEIMDGLAGASRVAVVLVLGLLLVFGIWLFGRGIAWLNQRDRAERSRPRGTVRRAGPEAP